MNLEDLNNDDVELGDLFIVQDTDVYESSFLPIQYESIEYEYSTVTNKYYIPTDSLCVEVKILIAMKKRVKNRTKCN